MNRRSFLKAMMGGAVALSAGGIALLEAQPVQRTFFLPPRAGWNAGSWELACAQAALAAVLGQVTGLLHDTPYVVAYTDASGRERTPGSCYGALLERRDRLIERVHKLERGWTGYSAIYVPSPDGIIKIHGGRKPPMPDGCRRGIRYGRWGGREADGTGVW